MRPALLTLACVIGCVPDPTIPPAAEIACARDDGCPGGFVCKPALGRCVSQRVSDQTPPGLDGAPLLTPESGTVGTVFRLELRVDEPLVVDPEVRIDLGTREARLELDEETTRREELGYAYSYTATGTEPEGRAQVVAGLLDPSGNLAPAVAVGSVRFDFTRPRLAASFAHAVQ